MKSLGVRNGVLLAIVLAFVTSCACQAAPRRAVVRPRVLVVGDSLVVESQDAIRSRIPDATVIARTGAAPCSLIDEAVRAARSADVAVLAFSGNNSFLAPCMAGSDHRIGGAYRDSYEDYSTLIGASKLRMALTPVWDDGHAANSVTARSVAEAWATTRDVPVVDAATGMGGDRYLAGSRRQAGEPGSGSEAFVALRAPDRVHLCVAPGYRRGFEGPACPSGSSAGVTRFAAGIARAARS
jgi:hypothetical protein